MTPREICVEERAAAKAAHARHDTDCGSSEVQIALFTARIKHITDHVISNPQGPRLAAGPPRARQQTATPDQLPPLAGRGQGREADERPRHPLPLQERHAGPRREVPPVHHRGEQKDEEVDVGAPRVKPRFLNNV